MNRRSFLEATALATAGCMASPTQGLAAARSPVAAMPRFRGAIDTNVTLGHWPFRTLPLQETATLVKKLRSLGLQQAWAGTYEGLFHNDVTMANHRLVGDCREHGKGLLLPVGTVNPMLSGWELDFERCIDRWQMRAIRIFPGYHKCRLETPEMGKLLDLANNRKLLVQLVVSLEDERTQHPFARVDHVNVSALPSMLKTRTQLRIQLLNWFRGVPRKLLPGLTSTGQVFVDIATVEGVAGIRELLNVIPSRSVTFGSHAPFFYPESALLKLQESELSTSELEAVTSTSATEALG